MEIMIGFSSPKSFKIGAEFIKLYQKKEYSHVFILFVAGDRKLVFHAAHGTVHFVTLENFTKVNKIHNLYQLIKNKELDQKQVEDFFLDNAGIVYGTMDLPKILLYDAIPFQWFRNLLINSTGYICSELVGRFLSVFMDVNFTKPSHLLTPRDIEIKLEGLLTTTETGK